MNIRRGRGFLSGLDGNKKTKRLMLALKIILIVSLVLWNMGPAIAAIAAEVGSGGEQTSTEQSAVEQPASDTEPAQEAGTADATATPADSTQEALPADGTETEISEPVAAETPAPATVEPAPSPQYMAYVGTDRNDYGPGQSVTITGGGYAPGEQVQIVIQNADDTIVYQTTATATAEGMVGDNYVIPSDGSASYAYLLTATGLTSGASAQTRFTDAAAVFITAPTILQAPGASGYTDDKAIPLEGIVGIEVTSASSLPGDAQAQLFRQNGDAYADFFIDGAATQPVTGGVFSGGQWHYWIYWNIEKVDPLAADITHYDQFRAEVTGTLLTTIYAPGPTSNDWVNINVDNRSSLNDSSLDFVQGAPSAITALVGDTFQIRAKYQESSTISALGIEAYYDASCVQLVGTHIYWYDTSVDPGSVATGTPAGYTQAWHDMPWVDPVPANVSANDWWVTAYDFKLIDQCAFFINPYIETRRQLESGGTQWKMDSGFNEVIAPGAIDGYKFNDLNGNGEWDEGEPPLEGWTIFLDLDESGTWNAGEPTTTTDANGYYVFSNVWPGDYLVMEEVQDGWTCTTGNPQTATVVTQETTRVDFGNMENEGSISGYKYNDLNGNGVWDNGEPPLEGWTINATDGENMGSDVTDVNGFYQIEGLPTGSYTVYEDLQTGWTQTEPANGDPYTGVTVTGGADNPGNDFGNFQNVTISGHKFNDLNANGVWDNGEPALEGWEISCTGQTPVMTDPSGYYEFINLGPGTYTVSETLKNGWIQTTPTNPDYFSITPTSGQNETDNDFGNYKIQYRISVTPDGNTNRVEDLHTFTILLEKNLGLGWVPADNEEVSYNWTGVGSIVGPFSPQLTDVNGEIHVTVQSNVPGSGTLTATFFKEADGGNIDISASADKMWINYRISVTPDRSTNQVGDEHIFTILLEKDEGFGWVPADNEEVSYNWTGVGSIVGPTSPQLTDTNGEIDVTVQSNVPGSGTLTATFFKATDGTDIDISESGDKTWIEYRISVTPDISTNRVGDQHVFTILLEKNEGSGWVPAPGEEVTYVLSGVGSIVGPFSPQLTDVNGEIHVTITSNDPGTSTLTANFAKGTDGSTILENDSADKSWIDYRISVTPDGETNQVGDEHVFTILLEKNEGSGWVPAPGESVDFSWSGVGSIVTPTSPQLTDVDGKIYVTVMSNDPGSGTLTAMFDKETDGSAIDISDSAVKSWIEYRMSITPAGQTNQVGDEHVFTILLEKNEGSGWVPAPGESVDFSWSGVGSIVSPTSPWLTDVNGEIDVTVTSLTPGTGVLTATFMTDTDGSTIEEAAMADKSWVDYQISVTPPTATNDIGVGHIFTITLLKDIGEGWEPAAGEYVSFNLSGVGFIIAPSSPAITDSNGEIPVLINSFDAGISTLTATFNLETSGSEITRTDSGEKTWIGGTIEGFKFNDLNSDGIWEPELGEEALPGWTIKLGQVEGEGINTLATTVTDENGHYIFENVSQGAYVVFELMQNAWASTTLSIQDAVIISQEQMNVRLDFGNQAQGVIIGEVCNDLNRNGVNDPGEPMLSDWVITLYEADGVTVLAQTTTDENGNFMFDNLLPGTYVVTETLIGPDWVNTTPISQTVTLIWNGEEGQFFARADFCNVQEFLPFTPEPFLPFTGGHAVSNNAANSTQNTSSPAAGWRNLFAGLLLFSLGATLLWLGLPSGRRYLYDHQNASR